MRFELQTLEAGIVHTTLDTATEAAYARWINVVLRTSSGP